MQIDLSYSSSVPLIVPAFNHVEFILVGAGGTGGFLISAIARLMKEIESTTNKTTRCTIIDHDLIEQKNIPRQNFHPGDMGLPKAQVLAARYALAFGIRINALCQRFNAKTIQRSWHSLNVIIGCVDNAVARQEINECLCLSQEHNRPLNTWWLDCGNHRASGQVLLGSSNCFESKKAFNNYAQPTFCIHLPSPALLHPELLEVQLEELETTPLSCAELLARNQQNLFVNQQVAAIASEYLLALTLTGGLRKFATYFDSNSGSARSLYISPKALERY